MAYTANVYGFVFAAMDGVGSVGAVLAGFVGEWDLRNCFLLAAGLSLLAGFPVVSKELIKNNMKFKKKLFGDPVANQHIAEVTGQKYHNPCLPFQDWS